MSLGGLYGGWHMTPPNVLLFCCIAAFNLTIGVKDSCVKMHVLVCAPQHGEAEWDSSAGRVVGHSEPTADGLPVSELPVIHSESEVATNLLLSRSFAERAILLA